MRAYIKSHFQNIDKWIIIPYLSLLAYSIIAVYSASSYSAMADFGNPDHYLIRQVLNVVFSLLVFFIVYIFPFERLKNKKTVQIGTGIIFLLLTVVLAFPARRGARRWIPFPLLSLQPAEFAKVFVIWYLSYIFSIKKEGLQTQFKQTIVKPGILIGAILFLILQQPDTGTAIIIGLMTLSMLSASGISLNYVFSFVSLGGAAIGSLFFLLYNFGEYLPFLGYRYDRFLGVWDPFGYYDTHGHQLVHSYYALNRGGFLGVGIGNSVQKTGYLPFPFTDFIVAIVGEEIGMLGLMLVFSALGIIIARAFYLGSKSLDNFTGLLYIGIGSMLLIQALINVAGITGVIPITGVTFPILSYGGSSLLVISISIALLANASVTERLKAK